MKSFLKIAIILLLICNSFPVSAKGESSYGGWDYLVQNLKKDGIEESRLRKVFGDPRMPPHEKITFSLLSKEHEAMYAGFTSKQKIQRGLRCLRENLPAFNGAERLFGVSKYAVASILLIETQCGDYKGASLVINRLARMASLNEPDNIEWNVQRLSNSESPPTFEQLEARANYLHQIFYAEVLALLKLTEQQELDVFSIRGSYAGAFGLPQFLPSTYLRYATDGNKDGIIDLMNTDDAVWSISHFLSAEGWNSRAPLRENRDVIWKYNHSLPYVDTILKVAFLLEQHAKEAPQGK